MEPKRSSTTLSTHKSIYHNRQRALAMDGRGMLTYIRDSAYSLFSISGKGAGDLCEQILLLSDEAARVFDAAELNESDILTLTRQDLNDLLPGPQHFKIRKKIAELISSAGRTAFKEPPVCLDSLPETLKDVFSRENLKNLPVAGAPLEDCLRILRDAETHLASSLDSVRQHVKLLESLRPPPPEGSNTDEAAAGCSHPHSKDESVEKRSNLNSNSFPVKIHSLVCGNTMGYHDDLVRRVGVPTLEVGVEECQIILVFCPVWSRAGTDIDAALSKVPGNKDAILVVMHYTFNPLQSLTGTRPTSQANIRAVHILFHDRAGGLLNCEPNKQAVAVIEAALKKYTVPNSFT